MINQFRGPYRFLSNFYVEEDGKTVEHYFQAAKATSSVEGRRILAASTPGKAKKLGRSSQQRHDWEGVKDIVMLTLLRRKFANPDLQKKLLATYPEELVEGNTWGDTYWGQDTDSGLGLNKLGQLLMQVREELRQSESEEEAKPFPRRVYLGLKVTARDDKKPVISADGLLRVDGLSSALHLEQVKRRLDKDWEDVLEEQEIGTLEQLIVYFNGVEAYFWAGKYHAAPLNKPSESNELWRVKAWSPMHRDAVDIVGEVGTVITLDDSPAWPVFMRHGLLSGQTEGRISLSGERGTAHGQWRVKAVEYQFVGNTDMVISHALLLERARA